MRIKILIVLLVCVLQQIYGSKSTKKDGSRFMKWTKNCLIALALNYGPSNSFALVNTGKLHASNSNSLACKYNVPDENAEVMMDFVKCARDQNFEKYMFDNSENCPKIKELYKEARIAENCPFDVPKTISTGALAKFRGDQLSHANNVEMLKDYLLLYPGRDGVLSRIEDVSEFLRKSNPNKNFDFFRFTSILELTRLANPDIALLPIWTEFKDVNADNAKKLLELTKVAYRNSASSAVYMALKDYKDVNVDNAKKLLEMTKIAYPYKTWTAVSMALNYKDVNADNAKKMLELVNIAYPDDAKVAVKMALEDYQDVNAENAMKLLELTKLAIPDDASKAGQMALQFKHVNADNAKHVLELINLAYPDATRKAVVLMALEDYKDVNAENAKKLFELTRLAYDTRKAGQVALQYKDSNAENTTKLLELIRLAYPVNARQAVSMALHYKDVNADKAKNLLDLTKLAYPTDARKAVRTAVSMALPYKETNVDQVKRVLTLTKILIPNDPSTAVIEALKPKYNDVDVDKVNKKYEELKTSSWLGGVGATEGENHTMSIGIMKKKYAPASKRVKWNKHVDVKKVDNWKDKNKTFYYRHRPTPLSYSEKYQYASRGKSLKAAQKRAAKLHASLQADLKVEYLIGKQTIMKKALKITYPDVAKEDF